MDLYDYIYVDIEKAISLYSQLTGGVVELRESMSENIRNSDNKRKYDFKVFKHDAGGTNENKEGLKEVIKPHHSFLVELEEELIRNGHLLDLSALDNSQSLKDESFRKILKNTFCIKVTGRCVIEDYERIKSIAQVFPEVIALIDKSQEVAIKQSPEYISIQAQIEEAEQKNRNNKDRNEKAVIDAQIKTLKKNIESLILGVSKMKGVDQWILDGMKTWIEAFLPGIINIRVYPNTERYDEHIFGHLKKEFFQDSDGASFHFTYGSMPTESVSMLGIITSIPDRNTIAFNPLAEFLGDNLTDEESVENAFRGVFRGFDGIEQLIRTCRYPRVLVYPLLVYRHSTPNKFLSATKLIKSKSQ